ncbi:zinc finger protein 777 [Drosophila rhopaloa]|uniref:Zinc finger protein 777 n=1 Tax=Drosophila rhopaloa TaxID=1041015 RepID=A0A6P4G2T8_DRORH|nr:zinc finger protein 777 [Drosophila rhopaloa]
MEADITPLAETNGEQRENPRESAGNPEQQPQELAKSLDSAEDGVSGAVGQIIDYLEEDGGATADQDQDAEMGEAEYLEGEMPQEDESDGLDGSQGEKTKPAGHEPTNKEDLPDTAAEKEDLKEKSGEEEEKDTEQEKEATPSGGEAGEGSPDKMEVDTPAEKDGEEADPDDEKEPAGPDDESAIDEGEEPIEEDEDPNEEGEEPTEEGEEIDQEFETATDAEGELITGDEPGELGDVAPVRERKKEEPVDENQCRVCTSKEELVDLFKKQIDATPADMLLVICPSVSILPKDFMPQFICTKCMGSLTIAIQLRKQLETTDQDLRKRLSRSKNKVRRPRGYVVIDAPVTDSSEDEDELDDEFKVSDVGGTTSADSDSADSDVSEKKKEKKKPGRPGRPRKKPLKRSPESDEEPSSAQKKKYQPSPGAAVGPFECPKCDLTFSRKQSYVLHRKTHERIEHACPICGKKFKVEWAYKTHMQRHEQERAHFRCELCPKIFRLRAELKHHMAQRHDEHGFIYECKRCQRTFLTQQRLQRHQAAGCQRHKEEPARMKEDQPRIKQEPRIKEERISHVHVQSHGQGNNSNMGKRRPGEGRDLFKAVAPPTTTYWSDSFSD